MVVFLMRVLMNQGKNILTVLLLEVKIYIFIRQRKHREESTETATKST